MQNQPRKENIKIGDIIVGHHGPWKRDYIFFQVKSFTKSGLPRVDQLPVSSIDEWNMPTQARHRYIVDTTTATLGLGKALIHVDKEGYLTYKSCWMDWYDQNNKYQVDIYW